MLTPLDIENKKFSKKMNGYSVDEVDNFLDELTIDYEKLYKEFNENKAKIDDLEKELKHFRTIEDTLQNTLIMAQSTAEETKRVAHEKAEQIISDAQTEAKEAVSQLNQAVILKSRELDDISKQFDIYKAKMESLLISQLELLKEINSEDKE